jgi:hypothetical protein
MVIEEEKATLQQDTGSYLVEQATVFHSAETKAGLIHARMGADCSEELH